MFRMLFERVVMSAAVWIAVARFGSAAVQLRGQRVVGTRFRLIQGGLDRRSKGDEQASPSGVPTKDEA